MKTQVNRHTCLSLITALVAISLLLSLQSCIADTLTPDIPSPDAPTVHAPNRFAAFRLVINDDTSTRAVYDSDNDDYNTHFNKGMEFESSLYLPSNSSGNDETEQPDNYEEEEDEEPDTPVEPQPSAPAQSYHFIMLFNSDGSPKSGILPLDLERDKSKDGDDYIAYAKYYDPSIESNPFENNFNGYVLVVLNASYHLEQELKEKLQTLSSTGAYQTICQFIPQKTQPTTDYFYYLQDDKGNYIEDKNGNPYLTMTSSMIIKDQKMIPAIEGEFETFSTLQEAKDSPTALYVERLQAKYTALFFNEGKYYYLKPISPRAIDDPEPQPSEDPTEKGTKDDPIGREHIVYTITDPDKQFKIVKAYERNKSVENRKEVTIETSTSWKANIVGWDINGQEKNQYLFKSVGNTELTNSYTWNTWDKTKYNYRIFWSNDPHYSDLNYPDQFRKVVVGLTEKPDLNGGTYVVETLDPNIKSLQTMNNANSLNYFDYERLKRRGLRKYVPENTFNLTPLGSKPLSTMSHLRVGSHIIIASQLLIKELDDSYLYDFENFDADGLMVNNSNAPAQSKFLMNNIYWSEQAFMEYVAEYLAYWMLSKENQDPSAFGPNDGNFYTEKDGGYTLAKGTDFQMYHTYIKGGDAKVSIYPKPGVTLYTKNPQYVEPSPDDDPYEGEHIPQYLPISEVNYLKLVYAHPELMAEGFLEGRMYYAAPSYHFDTPESLYNIEIGSFGTLRNFWYSFTIGSISKPGKGVAALAHAIVPNDLTRDAIGIGLSVIPWHKWYESVDVSQQNRPKNPNNEAND